MFGIGYSRIEQLLNSKYRSFLSVEMDFYAIFFNCGCIILFLLLSIIVKSIREGVAIYNMDKSEFFILLSFISGSVHAFLGGHVMTESMNIFPYYLVASIISSQYKLNRRQKYKAEYDV